MFRNRGFTLIEILVALLILAIVGSLTVVGLRSALLSQDRIGQNSLQLNKLQSAILIIERDLMQLVNRPVIDVDGTKLPALVVTYPGSKLNLEFTRTGFINPQAMQARSTLQRVKYVWDGNSLQRVTWRSLDRTANTPMDTQLILEGVKNFSVRFLDENRKFYTPGATVIMKPLPLPIALEVNLSVEGFGEVNRMIAFAWSQ